MIDLARILLAQANRAYYLASTATTELERGYWQEKQRRYLALVWLVTMGPSEGEA